MSGKDAKAVVFEQMKCRIIAASTTNRGIFYDNHAEYASNQRGENLRK